MSYGIVRTSSKLRMSCLINEDGWLSVLTTCQLLMELNLHNSALRSRPLFEPIGQEHRVTFGGSLPLFYWGTVPAFKVYCLLFICVLYVFYLKQLNVQYFMQSKRMSVKGQQIIYYK